MRSRYRSLLVWKQSIELVKEIYASTRCFPREELYGLTSQMRRASVSLSCNIAESQGRYTRKDCQQFLITARGSLLELETQLIIATELNYLSSSEVQPRMQRITEIERLLNGLIRYNRSRMN